MKFFVFIKEIKQLIFRLVSKIDHLLPSSFQFFNEGDSIKLSFGMRWSLIAHFTFIFILLFKSLLFPSKIKTYIPTLKVDLVSLPDDLKKDLREQKKKTIPHPKTTEKPVKKTKKKKSMVLKGKGKKKKEKERKQEISNALDRIKALQRIQEEAEEKKLKGNKISPGTTVLGEAKEAAEATYYDIIHDRIKSHWALPIWLARQNLSARAKIFIDTHGNIRFIRFLKSSNQPQFDEAVREAIQKSAPFPPPPDSLQSSVRSDGILLGFPL